MIDYKKSFQKLVEQIKFENGLADEELKSDYVLGMRFAYGSILRLAEKLEKGEFDFGDEGGVLEEDMYEIKEES